MENISAKTEKQFDLISSRHIVTVCSAAALLASILVIQGQKEVMNQSVDHQRIEATTSDNTQSL